MTSVEGSTALVVGADRPPGGAGSPRHSPEPVHRPSHREGRDPGIRALAGQTEGQFGARFGEPLTPEGTGEPVVDVLRRDPTATEPQILPGL